MLCLYWISRLNLWSSLDSRIKSSPLIPKTTSTTHLQVRSGWTGSDWLFKGAGLGRSRPLPGLHPQCQESDSVWFVVLVWLCSCCQIFREGWPKTYRLQRRPAPPPPHRNQFLKPQRTWVPFRRPVWRPTPWPHWEDCQLGTVVHCRRTRTRRRWTTSHHLVSCLKPH